MLPPKGKKVVGGIQLVSLVDDMEGLKLYTDLFSGAALDARKYLSPCGLNKNTIYPHRHRSDSLPQTILNYGNYESKLISRK